MNQKNLLSVALIGIIMITSAFVSMKPAAMSQEKKLPNITLEDADGNKVNIADLGKKGKVIVFSFWATWCTPCKKELGNMIEMTKAWKEKGQVEVYAVSIDDSRAKPKIKMYIDGQQWPYTVLLDVNQEFKRALNFPTVPYTVILDKNGNIVDTHSGYIEGDEYELQDKVEKLLQ